MDQLASTKLFQILLSMKHHIKKIIEVIAN